MSEPQYQNYFDHEPQKMGPMASQYWRDDPKLLGIHLARYKFVSKMLVGKTLVAEVGCGDGFFSKLVREQVGVLHLYDFDKKFIDHIYDTNASNAYVADITKGKLEYGPYQAIYSLDVMEHIDHENQILYLQNIVKSLAKRGVFIVGMPTLESQKYASPQSKVGHIGCWSGDTLKGVLNCYFHNVFLFSMNDEMVHTGFYPMSHYLIAICTEPK